MKKQLMPQAETLYVRRGLTMEQIAVQLQVSRGTIGKWSQAGDWPRKRMEWLKNSPQAPLDKLKERRLRLIEKMSADPNDDPTLEDRLVKITKVIEEMETRAEAIGPILDAMERYSRFVMAACDEGTIKIVRKSVEEFLAAARQDQA